jgi:hypothetical protein
MAGDLPKIQELAEEFNKTKGLVAERDLNDHDPSLSLSLEALVKEPNLRAVKFIILNTSPSELACVSDKILNDTQYALNKESKRLNKLGDPKEVGPNVRNAQEYEEAAEKIAKVRNRSAGIEDVNPNEVTTPSTPKKVASNETGVGGRG